MKEDTVPFSKIYMGDSRASSAEQDWLMNSGGHVISSEKELRELLAAVRETHDYYEKLIRPLVNADRAKRIREIRVDQKQSYRVLAGILHMEWGREACWTPVTNQIAGVVLCELAAVAMGEEESNYPWRDVA